MPSRELPPTLNLEQIQALTLSDNPTYEICHVFGIFKKEFTYPSGTCWYIFDELKEIELKLSGPLKEYSRPKPGDIVRVHRLRINKRNKSAEIPVPRNVVIWPAFQHDPKPISLARNPTISNEDTERRRVLETFYCSRIKRINEILSSKIVGSFQIVAGKVEEFRTDLFGHLELDYTDGTGRLALRVFSKTKPDEDDDHFNVAIGLKRGEFFVATNAKLDGIPRLNLSANLAHGRSLRKVEESSILGIKLKEAIGGEVYSQGSQHASSSCGAQGPRRKSPRLMKQNQEDSIAESDPAHTVGSTTTNLTATAHNDLLDTVGQIEPTNTDPKFTLYSDIPPKEHGYEFYDIIGQVRHKPHLTSSYGNCVMQIYDGSAHNHASYYAGEVEQVIDGCLVLVVYSKQSEKDTNEHFEKAMELKEGDILFIKNVKTSFNSGRIKLDLSANKEHGKSLNVIDKSTPFGRKVLDIVETPQVEELRETISQSSEGE